MHVMGKTRDLKSILQTDLSIQSQLKTIKKGKTIANPGERNLISWIATILDLNAHISIKTKTKTPGIEKNREVWPI